MLDTVVAIDGSYVGSAMASTLDLGLLLPWKSVVPGLGDLQKFSGHLGCNRQPQRLNQIIPDSHME